MIGASVGGAVGSGVGADDAAVLDAVLLIARAKSAADERIGGSLSRIGLSLDDLGLLGAVGAGGESGVAAVAIAAAVRLAPSHAVRSIRPLEKLGWIDRSEDRRFRLTPSGRAILAEGESIAAGAGRRWMGERGVEAETVRSALRLLAGDAGVAPVPDR